MGERTLTASRPHGGSLPSLLPLWEKVAVGGLWPPFFNRTPMLCIGYAKSVPDEGLRPIDRLRPLTVSHLRCEPPSHKGRGEVSVVPRANFTRRLCHISAAAMACYALACAQKRRVIKIKNDERKPPMEIGYFAMPSHPPECGLKEGHDWDLQVLRWLDELGYQEAWIGEHHTAPWEPHPAPDLLLAQAFLQTKNIRLGPGGFLLPYHHPAELANRVAMLDHLSGGRLNSGVAASGLPSDWAMFNVDGMSGQNRDMTREALEIILRLWTEDAPFTHKGKFWTVTKPDTMFDFLKPHLKPKQAPHPPIGVAGLSKGSDTLKLAGERGFIPMSLNLNPAYVTSHWDSVE